MSTTLVSGKRTIISAELSKGGRGTSWRVGLTGIVALLLGHAPLLVSYFRRLQLFEHYQFVPLLALGIVWLFWGRLRDIPRDELASGVRNGMSVGRLLIGCTMLAIATLFCSPWVGLISVIVCLGMFLNSLSGSYWRSLLPVWAFLFLMLRPPLHLDLTLITRLQLETSRIASTVLENLGVMHLMEGNVLVVPQRRFLVEEACSGIHSVFALLTAAAIYAVAMRLTLFRGVLLMTSSIFWACFMNLVRIAATIIAFENFEIDLSTGWLHSATGIVTFFLAVIFLAFTHQMLRFFLDPIDPHKVSYWEQDSNPFVCRWNGTSSRRRTQSDFAMSQPKSEKAASVRSKSHVLNLGVAGLAALAVLWQIDALKAEALSIEPPAVIANLTSDSLPQVVGNWVMRNYEVQQRNDHPLLSEFSKVWTYSGRAHGAVVSVDYPFRGWHQLSRCYQAQGWELDSYAAAPNLAIRRKVGSLIPTRQRHSAGVMVTCSARFACTDRPARRDCCSSS